MDKQEKNLLKIHEKIEKRKEKLEKNGLNEFSPFGRTLRSKASSLFKTGVGLAYSKKDCVKLGTASLADVLIATKGRPAIYAITHRSTYDAARIISCFTPQSYIISGDEEAFYNTMNEFFLNINGVLHFDRTDKQDRQLIIPRAINLLKLGESIAMSPEGVPNVYANQMLKLHPGIIRMSLGGEAPIVPIGNEIYVKRDKKGDITGDISYYNYEDYTVNELVDPNNDTKLKDFYNLADNISLTNAHLDKSLEEKIYGNQLKTDNAVYNFSEILFKFFEKHPKFKKEYIDNFNNPEIKKYLIKTAIVLEYRDLVNQSLNSLNNRMENLSSILNKEIKKKHFDTEEAARRNHDGYIDFYLSEVEKRTKKGKSTAYKEIDRHINNFSQEESNKKESEKIEKTLIKLK